MPFEILPHLFLGDANDAIHLSCNTKLVINCTKHLPFYSPDTRQIRISVEDDGNEIHEIEKYWTRDLFNTIVDQIMQEHDVLIHCQMGRQRSAATIAAFITWSLKWPMEKTIEHIKNKKRDAFFPEVNFINALDSFAKRI